MDTNYGEFENKTVQAAIAKATVRTTQRVGKFAQDEFAYVIAKVRLDKVEHGDFTVHSGAQAAKMYTRIQKFTTVNSVIVDAEHGAPLMESATEIADELFGVETLFTQHERDEDQKAADEAWDNAIAAAEAEEDNAASV